MQEREILFIHGAGETSSLWDEVVRSLRNYANKIAINLPGHPEGEPECKTVREYSEYVYEFIKNNGLRPVVCGHSMGGAIALTLSLEHQESVSSLILVSTGAKLGVMPEIRKGLEDEPVRTIEKVITPLAFYRIDESILSRARQSLAISNKKIFLNDYLACNEFDVRGKLKYVRHRTLIVCGDKDRMTPLRWSVYLKQNISDSLLYVVKNSGHMLPIEKPEILAGLIDSFNR